MGARATALLHGEISIPIRPRHYGGWNLGQIDGFCAVVCSFTQVSVVSHLPSLHNGSETQHMDKTKLFYDINKTKWFYDIFAL